MNCVSSDLLDSLVEFLKMGNSLFLIIDSLMHLLHCLIILINNFAFLIFKDVGMTTRLPLCGFIAFLYFVLGDDFLQVLHNCSIFLPDEVKSELSLDV